MDKLKKYLREHLDEMDFDRPENSTWQEIPDLQTQQRKPIPHILRYAIAASVLAATGMFIWKTFPPAATEKPVQTVVETFPAKADTVVVVQSNINNDKLKENHIKPVVPHSKKKFRAPQVLSADRILVNDIAKNYGQLVDRQLDQLRSTKVFAEDPAYFSVFKDGLNQINADETAIKKDIRKNGLSDSLLEELINLYQQKLNLLKNLRREINKVNNRVRQNELPTDSVRSYFLNI